MYGVSLLHPNLAAPLVYMADDTEGLDQGPIRSHQPENRRIRTLPGELVSPVRTRSSSPITPLPSSTSDESGLGSDPAHSATAPESSPLPKDELTDFASDSEDDQPSTMSGFIDATTNLPKISHDTDVDVFRKRFKLVMLMLKESKDERKAEYFELCIDDGSSCERWYEALPATTKLSWKLIEEELIGSFRSKESDAKSLRKLQEMKLSDIDAQKEEVRLTWIKDARAVASKIANSYTSDGVKAIILKQNLGPETLNVMRISDDGVEGVCEALRVLNEREVAIIRDRVAIHKAVENNASIESRIAAKYDAQLRSLQQQLNALTIVGGNKALTQNSSASTTVGPTHASPYLTRTNNPTTSTAIVPRANNGRSTMQITFSPDYSTQIQRYRNEHSEDVRIEWAVPLLGKAPLGSGECNGCGDHGHQYSTCQNLKLHVIEQKKRKLHNDMVRANRAAGFSTPTVVEPANFVGGSSIYSNSPLTGANQVQSTENRFTAVNEGNERGQES
ncbi:hypothetical protein QFC20_006420 [Naganishia adeliensis]|uniref:Uncharacterized protein n=1 Tax=Naganishia adeliensis TaxID=92952 RepID=A0ACC2VB95_9TREE|nr:hypothetical protein QFC20_006420 [Naganishia adeliensis]